MPSVAEQLRQAREKQNLSVHDVAELTKIKSDHIRALEESDYRSFSAPIYVRGFVRAYATVLKLNVPRVMHDLDQELLEVERFREPPSLTGPRNGILDTLLFYLSKVNWRVALPVLGALGLVLLLVWSFRAWQSFKRADPLADLGPGIYRPYPTNFSGEILPLPEISLQP